jgi:hypothetical protein
VSDALGTLTSINLDDLVGAFGWQDRPGLIRLARALFRAPARNFARQMLRFDSLIEERGLTQAACLTEQLYARSVRVYGRSEVPRGPVLFLANHPGVTDTLALLASLGRDDLTVIALDRPFLVSLPNLGRHLAFVTDQPAARVALVRKIGMHLRRGGAALTFPAGRNEIDPDFSAQAAESLPGWIDSANAFARLAPDVAIVPVCVRGVYWRKTAGLPLVRRRGSSDDQQLLGSALQLLANVAVGICPVAIRIQFGTPIHAHASRPTVTADLHLAVLTEIRRLITTPPVGEGEQVL